MTVVIFIVLLIAVPAAVYGVGCLVSRGEEGVGVRFLGGFLAIAGAFLVVSIVGFTAAGLWELAVWLGSRL